MPTRPKIKVTDDFGRYAVVWSTHSTVTHLLNVIEQGDDGRVLLCGISIPTVGPWWEEDELMAHDRHADPHASIDEAVNLRVSCKRCLARYERSKDGLRELQ